VSESASAPGFLLHQVLAAPLAALVRAGTISAMAFLDVINTVGFQTPAEEGNQAVLNLGDLRMVTFRYERQVPDGTIKPMTMQIPVLSLIPLPLVEAKESTFAFDVAITAIRPADPLPEQSPERTANLPEVELVVTLPPSSQTVEDETRAGPVMNVQMTVVRGDLPGGVLNLLQLINTDTIVEG
jgi:hypothetical protein